MSKSLENLFTVVAGGRITRRRFVVAGALGSAAALAGGALAGARRRQAESRPGDEVARQRILQADGGGRGKIRGREHRQVRLQGRRHEGRARLRRAGRRDRELRHPEIQRDRRRPGRLQGDGHADRQGGEGRRQGDQHRRRARQGRQEGGGHRSRVLRPRQPRRRQARGRRARPEARAGRQGGHPRGQPGSRQRRATQAGLHGFGY